jgi:lycopene cyclase domain-containing protein
MNALLDLAPRWHYLGVLVACVVLTLPLEWAFGARVYRRPRRLACTLAAVGVPFLIGDWVAVRAGLWSFSPRHTLGLDIFGRVPIEEALFFVVIPVCGLLTHGAVTARRWPWRRRPVPPAAATTPGATAEREPVAVGVGEHR